MDQVALVRVLVIGAIGWCIYSYSSFKSSKIGKALSGALGDAAGLAVWALSHPLDAGLLYLLFLAFPALSTLGKAGLDRLVDYVETNKDELNEKSTDEIEENIKSEADDGEANDREGAERNAQQDTEGSTGQTEVIAQAENVENSKDPLTDQPDSIADHDMEVTDG